MREDNRRREHYQTHRWIYGLGLGWCGAVPLCIVAVYESCCLMSCPRWALLCARALVAFAVCCFMFFATFGLLGTDPARPSQQQEPRCNQRATREQELTDCCVLRCARTLLCGKPVPSLIVGGLHPQTRGKRERDPYAQYVRVSHATAKAVLRSL